MDLHINIFTLALMIVERKKCNVGLKPTQAWELRERVEVTPTGISSVSDGVSIAQLPREAATPSNQSFQLILFHLIEKIFLTI